MTLSLSLTDMCTDLTVHEITACSLAACYVTLMLSYHFLSSSATISNFLLVFLQTPYPLLSRLNEAYNQLPAFVDSAPENQPDTPA